MISDENLHLAWASLLIEECLRNGADSFFLAPGARCTPLTLAVARHPLARALRHFDERGLGFAALGHARATGRPSVVITTSGTAVTNLHPAVVEAAMDGVPLLLLTADRPPELRDCGANQAIDQVRHFGGDLAWFVDLPCPDLHLPAALALTTIDQALFRARSGPVQVNCMFREPLGPGPDGQDTAAWLAPLQAWREGKEPYTRYAAPVRQLDEISESELADLLAEHRRVLVIAGGGLSESEGLAVVQLAQSGAWPVVADVCSGLLFGPHRSGTVRHVDAWLRKGFPEELRPDVVVQFGVRFLSKHLLGALVNQPPELWIQVASRPGRFDPAHRVTHRFVADADRICLHCERVASPKGPKEWLGRWLEMDRTVERTYHQHLDEAHTLSEPAVARAVTRLMPTLHGFVIASSMPVRDVNQFAAPNPNVVHVMCNRGASGIDGTLGSAAGFARGLRRPVTVLIGDLAALHDLNSLALLAQGPEPVIVVVINNQGGGIFHFLPMAETVPEFETWFGGGHPFTFEGAAAMFHLGYQRPETMADFEAAYRQALAGHRSCLIEVRTDRAANHQVHLALAASLDLGVR